jgi:hypothetical protein
MKGRGKMVSPMGMEPGHTPVERGARTPPDASRGAARTRLGRLRGLTQRGCGGGLTPVRSAGRYVDAFRNGLKHGHGTHTWPYGQRCAHPAWRIPRRRAHAPGQAEGVDTEGLRGGD